MRAFGATDADVARARLERGVSEEKVSSSEFEVWPENWDVWIFFLRCQTQWHYAGGGIGPPVRVGLNYGGVESVARMRGVPGPQLSSWADDLHLIELAVLAADSDKAIKRTRNKRAS